MEMKLPNFIAMNTARARSRLQAPHQVLHHSDETAYQILCYVPAADILTNTNPLPEMSELQVSHLAVAAAPKPEVVSV